MKLALKGAVITIMNESEFRQVYLAYKSEITRYLARLTNNAEDAEDLSQECFIRLLNAKVEIQEDKLWYYLRKTARNLAIDEYRKHSRRPKRECIAEIVVLHRDTPEFEMKESIDEIVSLVKNGEHRRILELRLIHGYSTKETARLVNQSEGKIRISLFHAMNRIRRTAVIS